MEEKLVLCRFGTPLEPLQEDEVPSKKPILIEDQIVTDENGRRRFHGAFTGGFSAGFWNTVGSLEGWTPKEFKSSRDEKTNLPQQKPSDFMDDEDLGEFGIAPQRVQTTAAFTPDNTIKKENDKKRKFAQNTDGPIPGIPVLHQLLEPSKDNIALRLLKRMGWKEGQGIGARQTKKEKKFSAQQNSKERLVSKKYGCDMGPFTKEIDAESNSSESDISDIEGITFAPDDFEPDIYEPKDNCFGLGYTGLSRDPVLKQHINLFGPLELLDNKQQKLSIRGKGFGVGALEEEDDDIYHHDDLSNYDFSLDKPSSRNNKPSIQQPQDSHIIEGFCSADESNVEIKKVFVVNIPLNFVPRNWLLRKSRFEPLDEKRAAILKQQEELKIKGLGRHDITLEERQAILEGTKKKSKEILEKKENTEENGNKKKRTYLEKINEKYKTEENKKEKILNMLASKSNSFVKSEIINKDGTVSKGESSTFWEDVQKENEKIKNEASKITKNMESTVPSVFKPFLADSAKQERYEKFLSTNFTSDAEITNFLLSIQPPNMSEWDRQMEKKEFEQAQKLFKPLKGIMSDRFVTETVSNEEKELTVIDPDRRGKTIRTKSIWYPVSLVCKRFNIAEPFVNSVKEENIVKKPKLSVFDYLESSVNKKETFVTPVVIPKTEEIRKVNLDQTDSSKRLSAKDMFTKEISSNKNVPSLEKLEPSEASIQIETEKLKSTKQALTIDDKKKENLKDKPKSALAQKIEEMKDKHPSEKKDLYKAVFEDSSDDEDTVNETNQNEKPSNSKDLYAILNKPAGEVNILRNNSPPRGIFAAFFKDTTSEPKKIKFNIEQTESLDEKSKKNENNLKPEFNTDLGKVKFKSQQSEQTNEELDNENSNIYGPKILHNSAVSSNQSADFRDSVIIQSGLKVDNKIQKLLGKHKYKNKVVEEWIEVTSESTKGKKNSKKDKKKKKKKEKSKHRSRSSCSSDSRTSEDSHRVKKKSKKSKKNKKHKK